MLLPPPARHAWAWRVVTCASPQRGRHPRAAAASLLLWTVVPGLGDTAAVPELGPLPGLEAGGGRRARGGPAGSAVCGGPHQWWCLGPTCKGAVEDAAIPRDPRAEDRMSVQPRKAERAWRDLVRRSGDRQASLAGPRLVCGGGRLPSSVSVPKDGLVRGQRSGRAPCGPGLCGVPARTLTWPACGGGCLSVCSPIVPARWGCLSAGAPVVPGTEVGSATRELPFQTDPEVQTLHVSVEHTDIVCTQHTHVNSYRPTRRARSEDAPGAEPLQHTPWGGRGLSLPGTFVQGHHRPESGGAGGRFRGLGSALGSHLQQEAFAW